MAHKARVFVWDGKFSTTESLPSVSMTFTKPLAGATFDWAADSLPDGALASWQPLAGNAALAVDGNAPQVISSGSGKAVALDGVSSRLRVKLDLAGAHTVACVFRFASPNANSIVHYGFGGGGAGAVAVGGGGTTLNASGGGRFIVPSPVIAPDTSWHVAILTVDGDASALRIDDVESTGTLPAGTRDGITLGYGASNTRTEIEYKRVAVIPGSMDAAGRAVLAKQLKLHYKI